LKLGVIGCGTIAPAYLEILTRTVPGVVEVVACADLRPEAARRRAQQFGIPRVCTTEELLDDPEIDAVANLTQAPAHHAVNLAVIRAGKHLFSEKPLALTREEGRDILAEAERRELAVAGAADIFLGPALQRAHAEITGGAIGVPIAAVAVITTDCFDNQHYHDVFRGALLDVGPYHLGAMTYLLGPVTRVAASAEIRFAEKPLPAPATPGSIFAVDQASTTAGVLDFESGPVGTIVTTQDAHTWLGRIEIVGTTGVLVLPDPVLYGGTLVLRSASGTRRIPMPLPRRFRGDARGFGVLDLASAVRAGRRPRADGTWMYHVLDVSLAHFDSSSEGRHVPIDSTFELPPRLESVLW
jgi:predicted dehydrogenase